MVVMLLKPEIRLFRNNKTKRNAEAGSDTPCAHFLTCLHKHTCNLEAKWRKRIYRYVEVAFMLLRY